MQVVVAADQSETKSEQKETFEVTRALPLDASAADVFQGAFRLKHVLGVCVGGRGVGGWGGCFMFLLRCACMYVLF